MTVAFLSGKRRRAVASIGAVSAGLLVLSACEKPTPVATVTVGTESVTSEAACYNDGKEIKESELQDCLNKKEGETVKVSPDELIRFGVDPAIADNGWSLFIDGKPVEQEPYTKTYRSLVGSSFFAETTDSTKIQIVESKKGKIIGIWTFTLKKS
ncbi:DUF2771 domain-containing protein [Streptomyces sp. NPDC020412]|uniref:DUF2771 domain-containing protein n=1 Tax=Streptomyces sp. NPDC020412 TaxID=3365073 RepID=UPI0037AAD31E